MTDKQQIAILRKALVDVVEKLGEMPGWRKVEDGLPKPHDLVLTWEVAIFPEAGFEDQIQLASRFSSGEWCQRSSPDFNRITHYHPVPAAPFDTPTLAETLQAICASALGEEAQDAK